MEAETTDSTYVPLPDDKVKWRRTGSSSFNKWARGVVLYVEGDSAMVRSASTSGRVSLNTKWLKPIDQLILVERPPRVDNDLSSM